MTLLPSYPAGWCRRLLPVGILLLLLGLQPRTGLAQRHIQHMNAFALQVGRLGHDGTFLRASYGKFVTDRTRFDVLAVRESGAVSGTGTVGKYSAYAASIGISRVLFRLGEVVYVHATLAVTNRYERTQEDFTGGRDQGPTPQRYTFGPQAGLDADAYLANRLSLCGSLTQSYLFGKSALDTWPTAYGVGLRYHFR